MAKRKVASTEEVVKTSAAPAVAAQPFWEKYQKEILYGLGGLALIALLWVGYRSFVAEPKQKEAVEAMWQAQALFESDSFALALNNPGPDLKGFVAIADEYGSTPAGNTAKCYAAICYLQTGDMDNAIKYMEDFDGNDDVLSITKYGVLGDAYSEKKDFDTALKMYSKAVDAGKHEVLQAIYLKKFAQLNDYQGNKDAAVKAYERLRAEFPNQSSADWRDVEKYIYRATGGTGK
jgi:tetratricopeptide (TPR) repeat protein